MLQLIMPPNAPKIIAFQGAKTRKTVEEDRSTVAAAIAAGHTENNKRAGTCVVAGRSNCMLAGIRYPTKINPTNMKDALFSPREGIEASCFHVANTANAEETMQSVPISNNVMAK